MLNYLLVNIPSMSYYHLNEKMKILIFRSSGKSNFSQFKSQTQHFLLAWNFEFECLRAKGNKCSFRLLARTNQAGTGRDK